MNIDSLALLNETVVDRIFDIFDEDFQLKPIYKDFNDFTKHIKTILKRYKITIEFLKRNNQNTISGTYYSSNNHIEIILPVRKFSMQEIMSVIFHEFAHFITEIQVPGIFNPTNDNFHNYTFPVTSTNNQYGIFGLFLEKYNSHVLMDQMLTYWTQIHERSNVAFSIAYDVYDENKTFKSDMINNLINSHLECWKKYHKDKDVDYFDKYVKNFNLVGSLILFSVIFYRQELTSRHELSRELVLNVPRLLELVNKYYKRVGGILNSAKNSKIYFIA